jgi:membrane protein
VRVQWHDVWVGAAFTALLFTVGKILIGLYLGRSQITSGFGAAGSLVLLMVWVYYSAQIFLIGAEFIWVYAHERGSRAHSGESTKGQAQRSITTVQGAPQAANASRERAL